MEWKEFTLDNGIGVIYKNLKEFYSVCVGVWVRIGSRFEDEKISGISHFIEHLLFKGTKKRTYREIKESVEGVGGSFNGFTSEEVTCYWIKILKDYFEIPFDVLSDMVQNPLFKENDIERERMVIIEEINMYRDLPSRYVHELFDEIVFHGHPLGRPISGRIESVKNIKREDLLDFLQKNYTAENIVLSICGNFEEDDLKRYSEKYFGSIRKSGKENEFIEFKNRSEKRLKVLYKETEQCHFCLGGLTFSRFDKRKYALQVLNIILGGNMSSRLFNEVREKRGLAYDIKSYVKFYQDTGNFVISAGVAPSKITEALKVIKNELIKIREKGVKKKEIEMAKKFLISQFLMVFEDNLEYMMYLGEEKLLKKKPSSIKETVESIKKVNKDDVENVARDILNNENLYICLIGPVKKEEDIEEILEIS
ncbi:MAG: insulinase family protein [Candidatus Omnitrophota bacterium]|nr:MAG: insulinase family protein [Candidatus Omnitrophota bacterium]